MHADRMPSKSPQTFKPQALSSNADLEATWAKRLNAMANSTVMLEAFRPRLPNCRNLCFKKCHLFQLYVEQLRQAGTTSPQADADGQCA